MAPITDKTQSWSIHNSYLVTHALQEPFVALYPLLAVLLTKNMSASPSQIAFLNMLKPTVAVLSFYWGSYLHSHTALTKPSLMLATSLAAFPFLFSTYISSTWIFIGLGAWYSLFSRAALPASLEILKSNTEPEERKKLFTQASMAAYIIGAMCSIIYGAVLDSFPHMWQALFGVASGIYISSIIAQYKMPGAPMKPQEILSSVSQAAAQTSWYEPWKQAKDLIMTRPDFLRFQLGFSIAGFGLMFAQPAITTFVGNLDISYSTLFIAMSLLKSLGFIIASPLWSKYIVKHASIHTLSCLIFVGFSLFLLTLGLCAIHPIWIFISYLVYGIAQAGSHLVWNLSGSVFARSENSTPYSSVNILMVGLRGAIAPPLGGISTELCGPLWSIVIGAVFCMWGIRLVVSEAACYNLCIHIQSLKSKIQSIWL